MDRLFCMQAYVRVVEHGAFARAADAIGVSRATVTDAVSQLEKRLGVRLLNRTTRHLSLTDEGRSYYEDCLRVLDQVAEAEDKLSGTRLSPRGRLRISVPQSFMNAVFFPALARFMERYPHLEVEVVLTDRAVNLVEEGIDCALRAVEIPPDSGLVARLLCEARWLTCAAPAYLAAHGVPERIDDLAQHECIRFVSPSTGRAQDWFFHENGQIIRCVPYGNLRLTSLGAATEAAVAGGGIAQVPDALVYSEIMEGRLEVVLAEHVAPAPSITLVYPGNRYVTAKVRAFGEFFADVFPAGGWWSMICGTPKSA